MKEGLKNLKGYVSLMGGRFHTRHDLPSGYATIASACMKAFQSLLVVPDTIAMIPIHGYIKNTRHSPNAIRWLIFSSRDVSITDVHEKCQGKNGLHICSSSLRRLLSCPALRTQIFVFTLKIYEVNHFPITSDCLLKTMH
ncbi:hypothetical protein CDAR_511961 [Caerostris darwini]|uniref:Uncharacterized protein n=1 Tax=Caerostris darwini TaxID=1538125 RepID=A0AAV4WK16_9ARAC|nr:hypothetical protein CDAR_511961 [Caerostris darwini]